MKCRQCAAEIADKALICYRCGTATTEAKYQPAPLRPKRSGPGLLVMVLLIALLLIAAVYYWRVHGRADDDARSPAAPHAGAQAPPARDGLSVSRRPASFAAARPLGAGERALIPQPRAPGAGAGAPGNVR